MGLQPQPFGTAVAEISTPLQTLPFSGHHRLWDLGRPLSGVGGGEGEAQAAAGGGEVWLSHFSDLSHIYRTQISQSNPLNSGAVLCAKKSNLLGAMYIYEVCKFFGFLVFSFHSTKTTPKVTKF